MSAWFRVLKDRFITPYTQPGLRQYDDLPVHEAICRAWAAKGIRPDIHDEAQRVVRNAMPLLGRALDRAAKERYNL